MLQQRYVNPAVAEAVRACPALVWELLPLEADLRAHWTVKRAPTPEDAKALQSQADVRVKAQAEPGSTVARWFESVEEKVVSDGRAFVESVTHTQTTSVTANVPSGTADNSLLTAVKESPVGALVKEILSWDDASD